MTTINTNNTNVRYYSIPRDSFEAGDCPTCTRCGCTMRHVTEINGALYGSNCGKIVLASMETSAKEIKKLVDEAAAIIPAATEKFYTGAYGWTADYLQARVNSCAEAGKGELAAAWGKLYAAKCKLAFNSPSKWGNWK